MATPIQPPTSPSINSLPSAAEMEAHNAAVGNPTGAPGLQPGTEAHKHAGHHGHHHGGGHRKAPDPKDPNTASNLVGSGFSTSPTPPVASVAALGGLQGGRKSS